jgi:hypothetical protein
MRRHDPSEQKAAGSTQAITDAALSVAVTGAARSGSKVAAPVSDAATNPPPPTLPPLPIIPFDPSAVSPSIWPGRTWTLKESANPRLFSARVCF